MSPIGRNATAAVGGGPGDGRRDTKDQARIEGRGDQVVGAEDGGIAGIGACGDIGRLLAGELRDGPHGGSLHLLVDRRRSGIERSPRKM